MTSTSGSLAQVLGGVEFSPAVTIQLTGDSRVALNHVAYEFSRRINPDYLWLEIRNLGEAIDPREPSAQGLVPKGQFLKTDRPQDMAPENAVSNMALWTVVREGDVASEIGHFVDFMRLPSTVQALFSEIERSTTDHRPGVLALVNGDRISEFYSVDLESTRAIIEVFKRDRITFIIVARGAPRPDRFAFDYVFRIETDSEASWASSRALCEQAPAGSGFRKGAHYEVFTH